MNMNNWNHNIADAPTDGTSVIGCWIGTCVGGYNPNDKGGRYNSPPVATLHVGEMMHSRSDARWVSASAVNDEGFTPDPIFPICWMPMPFPPPGIMP